MRISAFKSLVILMLLLGSTLGAFVKLTPSVEGKIDRSEGFESGASSWWSYVEGSVTSDESHAGSYSFTGDGGFGQARLDKPSGFTLPLTIEGYFMSNSSDYMATSAITLLYTRNFSESNSNTYYIEISSGSLLYGGSETGSETMGVSITPNTWIHLSITINSTSVTYIAGSASITVSNPNPTFIPYQVSYNLDDDSSRAGYLDDLRFYDSYPATSGSILHDDFETDSGLWTYSLTERSEDRSFSGSWSVHPTENTGSISFQSIDSFQISQVNHISYTVAQYAVFQFGRIQTSNMGSSLIIDVYSEDWSTGFYPPGVNGDGDPYFFTVDLYLTYATNTIRIDINGEYWGSHTFAQAFDYLMSPYSQVVITPVQTTSYVDDVSLDKLSSFPPTRALLLNAPLDSESPTLPVNWISSPTNLNSEITGGWTGLDYRMGGATSVLLRTTGSSGGIAQIAYISASSSTVKVSNPEPQLYLDFYFNFNTWGGLTTTNSPILYLETDSGGISELHLKLNADHTLYFASYTDEGWSEWTSAGTISLETFYRATIQINEYTRTAKLWINGAYQIGVNYYDDDEVFNVNQLRFGAQSDTTEVSMFVDNLRVYNSAYLSPASSYGVPSVSWDFESTMPNFQNVSDSGNPVDGDQVHLTDLVSHSGSQSLEIENPTDQHTYFYYDIGTFLGSNTYVSFWVFVQDFAEPSDNSLQSLALSDTNGDGVFNTATSLGDSGYMVDYSTNSQVYESQGAGYVDGLGWSIGSVGKAFYPSGGNLAPVPTGKWIQVISHYFITTLGSNNEPYGCFETYVDGELIAGNWDVDNMPDPDFDERSFPRWIAFNVIHGQTLYIDDVTVWSDTSQWVYTGYADEDNGRVTSGYALGTQTIPMGDGDGSRLFPYGANILIGITSYYNWDLVGYFDDESPTLHPYTASTLSTTATRTWEPLHDFLNPYYYFYWTQHGNIPFDLTFQENADGEYWDPSSNIYSDVIHLNGDGSIGYALGLGELNSWEGNFVHDNRVLARDSNGVYHYLWIGETWATAKYANSTDEDDWLTSAIPLTFTPNLDSEIPGAYSSIATDSQGNVHVVMCLNDSGLGDSVVYYAKLVGGNFTDIKRLEGTDYPRAWAPTIRVDDQDKVHIAFIGDGDDGTSILYVERSALGIWSTVSSVFVGSSYPNFDGFNGEVCLEVDNNHKNRIVFTGDEYTEYDPMWDEGHWDSQVFYTSDASGSWSTPLALGGEVTITGEGGPLTGMIPYDHISTCWSPTLGLYVVYGTTEANLPVEGSDYTWTTWVKTLSVSGTWSTQRVLEDAFTEINNFFPTYGLGITQMTLGSDDEIHFFFNSYFQPDTGVRHYSTPLTFSTVSTTWGNFSYAQGWSYLKDWSGNSPDTPNWGAKVRYDTFGSPSPSGGEGEGGSVTYLLNLRRFENGTVYSAPYTASIQLSSGYLYTKYVDVDSTVFTASASIWSFTYPLQDPDEYRTLYAPSSPITPFLPGPISDQYLFTIQDLTGYLSGKVAYLEAWRTVGVNSYVVDSAVVNGTVNGIPLTLTRNEGVRLKLLLPGNSTRYEFGYFLPTGNPLTHTLIFNWVGFENTMHYINAYISATAIRNNSTIDVVYANTLLGYTFSATASVYLRNGTLVSAQSSTLDTNTLEFTGLTPSTDYVVMLSATHSYFPTTIKKAWTFAGSWSPFGESTPTFPDFNVMGWSTGGVSNLIGVLVILFVAGVFSFASGPLGIIITILVAGVEGYMGIVSIPLDLLAFAFSLAIIYAIGRRNN